MDEPTYQQLRTSAESCLSKNLLSDALTAVKQLNSLIAGGQSAAISEVETSYDALLKFSVSSTPDPDRLKVRNGLVASLRETLDDLCRTHDLKFTSSRYARTCEKVGAASNGWLAIPFTGDITQDVIVAFNWAWTSPRWNAGSEKLAAEALDRFGGKSDVSLSLVSGITLGCLRFFDRRKMLLLASRVITPNETDSPHLRARLVCGLVLICLVHSHRVGAYPQLVACLKLLADVERISALMLCLQKQLYVCLETPDSEKKLNDSVMPGMMRGAAAAHREIMKRGGEGNMDFPQWEESWGKTEGDGLFESVESLIEMERKGVDIFLPQFRKISHRFTFWNDAANWFAPFSTQNPAVATLFYNIPDFGKLFSGRAFSDADKYSFCLVLNEMPSSQISALAAAIKGAAGGPEGMDNMHAPITDYLKQEVEAMKGYVQSLYRFFKLSSREDGQNPDPFSSFSALNIMCSPHLSNLIANADSLKSLTRFVFDEGQYDLALEYLRKLDPSAEVCQKIGYCEEMAGHLKAAANAYTDALLETDAPSPWTLRRLADVLRKAGRYGEALSRYQELAAKQEKPDVEIFIRQGECLMGLGRYEEALSPLEQAYILSAEGITATRALAWCNLWVGRFGSAASLYGTIVKDEKCLPADWLNFGHAKWLAGDRMMAVTCYRNSLGSSPSGSPIHASLSMFDDDKSLLLRSGLTEGDLALMVDMIGSPLIQ